MHSNCAQPNWDATNEIGVPHPRLSHESLARCQRRALPQLGCVSHVCHLSPFEVRNANLFLVDRMPSERQVCIIPGPDANPQSDGASHPPSPKPTVAWLPLWASTLGRPRVASEAPGCMVERFERMNVESRLKELPPGRTEV